MAAMSEYFFLIVCLVVPFLECISSPLGEDLDLFFRSWDPLELLFDFSFDLDLFDPFDSLEALDPTDEF